MLSQFRLSFCQTQNRMPYFIVELMSILVLIGMVFVIIGEMFHGRISLNSVLLLLLVNFVSEFRVESMYISCIVSIKSRVTHLHGFQLFFFVATVHINHFVCLYQQNKSSESKGKFGQAKNCSKRVLEATKLVYAIKTKECMTSQKLGSWDLW